MSAPVPDTEPTTFAAGETVVWNKSLADYPSTDGWSLVYSIRGPTDFDDVIAQPQSDGTYSVTLSVSLTEDLSSGTYKWKSHAYKGGPPEERYAIVGGSGVFFVTQDLGQVGTYTTHASRALALIESALEARAADPHAILSYSIAGRAASYWTMKDLYMMRNFYRVEVSKERYPSRSNPLRSVTFVSPK